MPEQNFPQLQPQAEKSVKIDNFKKLFPLLGIIIFILANSVGVFLSLQKKNLTRTTTDTNINDTNINKEIVEETPNNFSLYKEYRNESLGVNFLYPKDYIKLTDTIYPIPLVTFVSAPDCADSSLQTGEQFGDCYVLNVWQQPQPYNFNWSSTNFYRNESFQLKNSRGTIKTYEEFGTEITTIQIPRYDKRDINKFLGELIIQYSYGASNANRANEILKVLLENLEVSQTYVSVSPTPCCKQDVPTMLVRNAERFWIFQQNKLTEIPIALDDSIGGEKISPDGNKIAFFYWNHDRDAVGFFDSAKTGIAVVETKAPFKMSRLIDPGIDAHTYLSWSPDGRYLSYVLNSGQGVGMLDTITGKEVFRFSADNYISDSFESGGRPIVWVDEDRFSFVFNGRLYLGTLSNPTKQVIATNVTNAEPAFEAPPFLYEPLWSPDGTYVMYRTKDSAIIQNINTNKKYQFGKQVEYGLLGFHYLSVSAIGWTKNNEFLFREDNKLKLIRIQSDDLSIQEITEISGDNNLGYNIGYNLVGNGPYVLAFFGDLTTPLVIYDLEQKKKICNLKAGKFYAAGISNGNTYVLANPLVPKWKQWQNDYSKATNQARRILEIFNINSCELLGGFVLDNDASVDLDVQFGFKFR
jgi:hypothetical protein